MPKQAPLPWYTALVLKWSFAAPVSVWSILSALSALSILGCTSVLSIFSLNSVLSIYSMNSVLSVGCTDRIYQMCNNERFISSLPPLVGEYSDHPKESFVVQLAGNTCHFGSCGIVDTCALDGETLSVQSDTYTLKSPDEGTEQSSVFFHDLNVFHPRATNVQYKEVNGEFLPKTLQNVIDYKRVSDYSLNEALDSSLSDLPTVFDLRQIFALYTAELLGGQTNGFCRGGNKDSVTAYRHNKKIILVPRQQIKSHKCNAFSWNALKPVTMPDCAPMKKCLQNKGCSKLFEEYTKEMKFPCAYTHSQFILLFALPATSFIILLFAFLA